ncbi:restriction endonuclease subunit S [Rheinheimera sp. UJ63]|uniref:restriction endonuclease subunit S n=1 Tax=Rheinheimera sp. UJ63 TaxID=2910157 RepID=UPI001F481D84|nr:restriction endonuclease subunit S [Rheinheimera sp. UJ63]MCF4008620.1 restriction endonuclease subunit S [Rheinheimera sp. UJ63]
MSNSLNGKLGNLVSAGGGKIHTGPFGSQLHASDYVPKGIPCIMPANMKNNRVDLSNIAFITELDAKRLSKYIVKENDIVYSRRGDVTQKALIRKHEEGYFCGTGCLLLRPGKKFDARFLTHYLSTQKIQNWIVSQAVGATMPNLNTGILSSIPFHGPEKAEQERIANVLSAIEEKIELNNRINAELEAMAKTLYDYWFVQFDFPDANGKPYKTSGGKLVYNTALKREIPEGWNDSSLVDIAIFTNGIACQKYYPTGSEPTYKVIKIREFSSGFDDSSESVHQGVPEKVVVNDGDILFSWSATLDVKLWTGGKGALNQHIFKVTSDSYPKTFYYFEVLKYLEYFKMVAELRKTTMGHITKDHLIASRISLPPKELIQAIDAKLSPMLSKIIINNQQNTKLAKLRDWLLPMLMNGQVTVK